MSADIFSCIAAAINYEFELRNLSQAQHLCLSHNMEGACEESTGIRLKEIENAFNLLKLKCNVVAEALTLQWE